MQPHEFYHYVKIMAWGYHRDVDFPPHVQHKWFINRTDELLTVENSGSLNLVCAGTHAKLRDWVWNLASSSTEWLDMGRVHRGFTRNVDEILGGLHNPDSLISLCYDKCVKENKAITITGHSRGGAIAMLIATKLRFHGLPADKINVITCANPKLGCKRFQTVYKNLLGDRTHVLNGKGDLVRFLPPWGHTNGQVTLIDIRAHRLEHYEKYLLDLMK